MSQKAKEIIELHLGSEYWSFKESEKLLCDICGSNDVIEAPHMGSNCNRCNPL